MNSKILLLTVSVIAVGLFAMPSTLSLFNGQHTFYSGPNVKCEKCHSDIYTEFNDVSSTAHTGAWAKQCEGCHKTTTAGNVTGAKYNGTQMAGTLTRNVTSDPNAHAAITLECIACHQGVDEELRGSNEAHTIYYYGSARNTSSNYTTENQTAIKLKGANTACVGCHTHTAMNVTWTRSTGYNMVSNGTSGAWVIGFSMNASTVNKTSADT